MAYNGICLPYQGLVLLGGSQARFSQLGAAGTTRRTMLLSHLLIGKRQQRQMTRPLDLAG
jgi:hypothetical protein